MIKEALLNFYIVYACSILFLNLMNYVENLGILLGFESFSETYSNKIQFNLIFTVEINNSVKTTRNISIETCDTHVRHNTGNTMNELT